jgi:hypothetical protein
LIRAAKLQLAAAATLAAWLQTRVSTDAGAAHPNCRRRMTTRISWKWEDCSHAMLLLRVPERKDKVGWGGVVEDERLLCRLVVVFGVLALDDVQVRDTYGKTCCLSRRTRRKRQAVQYDRPRACRRRNLQPPGGIRHSRPG